MGSFSFVDRITAVEAGVMARGTFVVPRHWTRFPLCLVAEAVGQLAAWTVMAHADFQSRPLAGLAHAVNMMGETTAGARVDLSAEIHRCDRDVVLYSGSARVHDVTIVELHRCVGPMLPMLEFDDPASVRERYQRLCREGVAGRERADGAGWVLTAVHGDRKAGQHLTAEVLVPEAASFFADHFPRKPVLPATLLLDAKVRLAAELAREAVGGVPEGELVPVRIRDAKVRAFTSPGQRLILGAQARTARATGAEIVVYAKIGSKPVATARVELAVV